MTYKINIRIGKSTETIPKNNCLEVLTFEEILMSVIQVCDLSN